MNIEEAFENNFGPHFTYDEFRCKCERCTQKTARPRLGNTDTGDWFLNPEFKAFMWQLIKLRNTLAFPFIINSGYRCPDYNDQIYRDRGEDPGLHLDGPHTIAGADVKVSYERGYMLVAMALSMNMGIGIHQRGKIADRYIHLDNIGPRLWSY